MIKFLNQILVFILEIAMLISYGYFGLTREWNFPLKISFSVILVCIAILVWSIFAAPKSGHRLEMPYLQIFRMFMFSLSAFLLFQSGLKNFAALTFILALLSQIICLFTE